MFKIVRTVKQIFNVASNVPKSSLSSINNIFKYSMQSKGYIEDAGDEFTFTKVLPDATLNQDKFKVLAPNPLNIAKVKHTQLLDSAEIRKLIYARFADEIAARPSDAEENQNLETKSNDTKEHVETFMTLNIADEFNDLKSHGYDFAATREILQNRNQDTNQNQEVNQKNLFERMKDLSISGYISNYAGESSLRSDIEKVIIQKELVINELMQRLTGELEEHSIELLG